MIAGSIDPEESGCLFYLSTVFVDSSIHLSRFFAIASGARFAGCSATFDHSMKPTTYRTGSRRFVAVGAKFRQSRLASTGGNG